MRGSDGVSWRAGGWRDCPNPTKWKRPPPPLPRAGGWRHTTSIATAGAGGGTPLHSAGLLVCSRVHGQPWQGCPMQLVRSSKLTGTAAGRPPGGGGRWRSSAGERCREQQAAAASPGGAAAAWAASASIGAASQGRHRLWLENSRELGWAPNQARAATRPMAAALLGRAPAACTGCRSSRRAGDGACQL